MPNIDLYVGKRTKRNYHEKVVLSRVLKLLAKHGMDAVIFCDIWLDDHQVDILVGTEMTTLQLEVKGWRWPVCAQQNGDWEVIDEDGAVSLRDNAYLQALGNNQKLRNEMARHLGDGVHVSFPNGAVIFEPKIHPESRFNMRPDPRVVMRGSDQLEDLLNTPSPSPWRLSWMRDFAQKRKFIRLPVPEFDDEPSSWPVDEPRQGIVTVRDMGSEGRRAVADVLEGRPAIEWVREHSRFRIGTAPATPVADVTLEQVPASSARAVAMSSYPRGGALRSRSLVRRLIRLTPILCASLVAVYTLKAMLPLARNADPSHVAVAQRASGRHPNAKHVSVRQHAKESRPKAASIRAGDASADATPPNSQNSTYGTSVPPAPITCPAGVDRLGCNGRIGTFSQPECPAGFSVSGGSCIRAQGG